MKPFGNRLNKRPVLGELLPSRSIFNAQREAYIVNGNKDSTQKGAGILDLMGKAIRSGTVSSVINAIPASDENARSLFPNERHIPLLLSNGRIGMSSYAGPGTQTVK